MIGNVVRVTAALMITTNPSQALSTTTTAAIADKAKLLVRYLGTALLPGFSTSTNRRRVVIIIPGATYHPGVARAVEWM